MSRRAILYARVSTEDQAEKGYSLPTQLEACRKYAEQREFTILIELMDDCSGTIAVNERPAGKRIYELVNAGAADALILYTHDRTARDEKVIEYLLFKAYLYERGVELHYADTGLDPYTLEGNLVGYIKSHYAAEERKKIGERTMRGKRAKAKAGKWVGASKPPYGYRYEGMRKDKRLVINEQEAAVVRRIYALYTGISYQRPLSLAAIAELLTSEQVPPPARTVGENRGWYKVTIKRLIDNPRYKGMFSYDGMTINLPDLAIVDSNTWAAAQTKRKTNQERALRNCNREYLLIGHIRCSCGGAMGGWPGKGGWIVYRCIRQADYRHLVACEQKAVLARKVESIVWNWLVGLLEDESNLERGIRQMKENEQADLAPKRERLENARDLIKRVELKIKRLIASMAETEDEFTVATIKAELRTAQKQRTNLLNEAEELHQQINQRQLSKEDEAEVKRIGRCLRERIDNATFSQKRFLLNTLDVSVRLRQEDAKLWIDCSCGLKLDEPTFELHSSGRWYR
jgi:site-specific DNA recombinase